MKEECGLKNETDSYTIYTLKIALKDGKNKKFAWENFDHSMLFAMLKTIFIGLSLEKTPWFPHAKTTFYNLLACDYRILIRK